MQASTFLYIAVPMILINPKWLFAKLGEFGNSCEGAWHGCALLCCLIAAGIAPFVGAAIVSIIYLAIWVSIVQVRKRAKHQE